MEKQHLSSFAIFQCAEHIIGTILKFNFNDYLNRKEIKEHRGKIKIEMLVNNQMSSL